MRYNRWWNTFDDNGDNGDFALFDKMLPCLSDQFRIDPKAVFATGHSAGGLMTSFLTMHRSDVLAATKRHVEKKHTMRLGNHPAPMMQAPP